MNQEQIKKDFHRACEMVADYLNDLRKEFDRLFEEAESLQEANQSLQEEMETLEQENQDLSQKISSEGA